MRKAILLISLICILTSGFAKNSILLNNANSAENQVELISSNDSQTTIKVKVNAYSLDKVKIDGTNYVIVNTNDATRILEQGAPDLPKFSQSIIIPDAGATKCEVISSKYIEIEDVLVAPSKGNFTRDIDPSTVAYNFGKAYSKDAFYPGELASLFDPYILRDYRGQSVVFTPFHYNPVTKTLRIYTDFVVTISKTNEASINNFERTKSVTKVDRQFQTIYKRQFLNYETNRYTAVPEDGEILIICHPDFLEPMEPYVSWKIQKGIQTTMIDYSTLGSSSAISAYVDNFYANNNLTYLLLVGDASFVPTINAAAGHSDNSYGYISGGDSYSEVFVGRFSAENVAHVQTMVERVIDYELTPDMSDYYQNSIGLSSNQGPGDDNEMDYEHIRNMQLDLNAYNYTGAYEFFDGSQGGLDASGNPTASAVGTALNTGAGVLLYTGHGSNTSFSSSGFGNTNVNSLTNTGKLPFIWSVACVNGNFVPTTCFAEAWTRAEHNNEPSGAIATLMSTINQSWDPPMCGQDEMVDILTESYSNNILRSFGAISMNGCMEMNDEYQSQGTSQTDTWNIFGDPSIMLRTAQPIALTATHSPSAFLGSTQFTVNCPVDDAIAAITVGNEIYGVGTVANGMVNIQHQALSTATTLTLTVTAYNHVPYVAYITVVPNNGPYVTLQGFTINDQNGNQNYAADYNEEISLDLSLKNIGIEKALNVVGVLTTTDPFATITNDTYNYGDIDSSANLNIAALYEIEIADNIEDQYTIPFTLTLTDDAANTWTAYINLTVNAPSLALSYVEIDDAGQSDVNGRLDPGETVIVKLSGVNMGHAAAIAGNCELITSSTFLDITNTLVTNSGLEVGAPIDIEFTVYVSPATPIAHIVTMDFELVNGAYTASTSVDAKVGLIVEDWESSSFSTFEWMNDNSHPWTIISGSSYEGNMMARSANISDSQSSTLQITIDVLAADSISFFKKVSCEEAGSSIYDYLEFKIDNVSKGKWAGEIDWSKEAFAISAGTHTLKWVFVKDGYVSDGQDCAWVDFIEFPALDINYAPVFLTTVDTFEFAHTDAVDILIETYDANSDALVLSSSNLPAFLSITDNGNETASISGSPSLSDAGSYTITVSVDDGNAAAVLKDYVVRIYDAVSVEHTNLLEQVRLYPNPANNMAYLEMEKADNSQVAIIDMQGRTLAKLTNNGNRFAINTSSYPAGVYYIRIIEGTQQVHKKLVIIR